MEILIVLILAIIAFSVYHSKKKSINKYKNTYDNKIDIKEFQPYKIIENDNALEQIVENFEERKKTAYDEIARNLGKALPNDVIWKVLQELFLETFLKNHKIFLNTAYQQGLLLQKEKKYKESISHYSYGLYYLMCHYNAKFNPQPQIIDFVENDTQVIEMAQHKFINKIQLCAKYANLDESEIKKYLSKLIKVSTLSNMNFETYYNMVKYYIIQKKDTKDEIRELNTTRLNMLNSDENDDDIFDGWEFVATLQLRTPLEVLKHHNEKIFDKNKKLPNYIKEEWEGTWIPIVKPYELIDKNAIPEGNQATDIGQITKSEANEYCQFLIKFKTISESDTNIKDKISQIKKIISTDKVFRKYFKKVSNGDNDFLEYYFGLTIRNILPSNVAKILNESGYKLIEDLKGANIKEISSLKGIGKATIDKITPFL